MGTSALINQGVLYIVATPIGNMDDITLRAIDTLKSVDVIFAEDTRHSGQLLRKLGIETALTSLHQHNEKQRATTLLAHLEAGKSAALISDAGTPLISDPGYPLVAGARALGLSVVPIPGPSALITALSASGLATDRFVFEGFLPSKAVARQTRLESFKKETRTTIFYEAPHRILALLEDIFAVMGEDRQVVLAKELTKTFETFFSGDVAATIDWLKADSNHQRGEFVVLLAGEKASAEQDDQDLRRLLVLLLETLPLKQAVKLATSYTGINKNTVYRLALTLQS